MFASHIPSRRKPSDAEGGIWFSCAINEQTVCEADRKHRRCEFASHILSRRKSSDAEGVKVKLYFVRHGETDWNLESKIQGRNDIPLNATGISQAEQLAMTLKMSEYDIKAIYSSRQKRALVTAEIVGKALGIPPVVKDGLQEMSLGSWEGHTWPQVREIFADEYQIWYKNRRYQVPPGGESYQQLLDRLLPALSQIMEETEGNALIVTHSAIIMTLMSYIYDTPFEDMAKNYKTGNTGIVELEKEELYKKIYHN